MPALPLLLLVCAATASVLYLLRFCNRPKGPAKSVVKTASTLCLALAAVSLGAPPWLTLALALGAFGDLMLSRDGDRAFLAGLVAFAAAHLAYVALFATLGAAEFGRLGQPDRLLPGLLVLVFGAAMARVLWPAAGALRGPVMAYIGIILAMGLTALALPGGAGPLPVLAAAAFIASDAILAAELFLLPDTHPARRITPYAVWLLYWTAQAGFLAAFAPVGAA